MIMDSVQVIKILLVDDHPFMQKVVSQLIVSSGFKNVETAGTGAEALEKLKKIQFQLLITDLEMEPIDGYDIVREIRTGSSANRRDLPVLVMTTHTEAELVTRCLMFDINGFIVKPVDQRELTKKIISALARKIRLKTSEEYSQIASNWSNSLLKNAGTHIQNQTLHSLENAHQFLTTSIPVNDQGLVKAPLPIALLGTNMSLAANVLDKDQKAILKAGLILTDKALNILNKNKDQLFSEIIEVYMDVNRFKLITAIDND
jgi:two-component system, chemotaxis family, chemotaxis protein CheY